MARPPHAHATTSRVASLPALARVPGSRTIEDSIGLKPADSRQTLNAILSPPKKHSHVRLSPTSRPPDLTACFRSPIVNLEVEFATALDGETILGLSHAHGSPERSNACFQALRKLTEMVAPTFRPLLIRLHDELLHSVYDCHACGRPAHSTLVIQLKAQLTEVSRALEEALADMERLKAENEMMKLELNEQDEMQSAATNAAQADAIRDHQTMVSQAVATNTWHQKHLGSIWHEVSDLEAEMLLYKCENVTVSLEKYERLEEAFEEQRAQLNALRRDYRELEANARESRETDAALAERVQRREEEADYLRARVAELEGQWTPRPAWDNCNAVAESAGRARDGDAGALPGLRPGQSSKMNLVALNLALQNLWARIDELERLRPNDMPFFVGVGLSAEAPKWLLHEGRLRNLRFSRIEANEAISAAWDAKLSNPDPISLGEALALVGTQKCAATNGEIDAKDWLYSALDAFKRLSTFDAEVRMFNRIILGEVGEEEWHAQQRVLQKLLEELRARDQRENGTVTGRCSLEAAKQALLHALPTLSFGCIARLIVILRGEALRLTQADKQSRAELSPLDAGLIERAMLLPELPDDVSAEAAMEGGAQVFAAWKDFTYFDHRPIVVPYASLLRNDVFVRSDSSTFAKALCEQLSDEPDAFSFAVQSLLLHTVDSTPLQLVSIEKCRAAIQAVDPQRAVEATDSLLVSIFLPSKRSDPKGHNTAQPIAGLLETIRGRRVAVAEVSDLLTPVSPRWHGRARSMAETVEAFLRLKPPKKTKAKGS